MSLPLAASRAGGHGFTLVELLVVMAILGVLAAAVMPLGEALVTAQKERELRRALWEVRDAIDAYKRHVDQGLISADVTESGYPASLQVLVSGAVDARAPGGERRWFFLRRVPRDPFADPVLPAERTWVLRSHASPPDRPTPGADVFDIRSSSDAVALDGSRYANW